MSYSTCPDDGTPFEVERTNNGVAIVWHGICPRCGWAHAYMATEDVYDTPAEAMMVRLFNDLIPSGWYLSTLRVKSQAWDNEPLKAPYWEAWLINKTELLRRQLGQGDNPFRAIKAAVNQIRNEERANNAGE